MKMNAINQPFRSALLTVGLTLVIAITACDFEITPPDPPPPPVTEILRVEYTPMQIHTGDSVTFKVVIKDSLLSGLMHRWYLGTNYIETSSPQTMQVIANAPGHYSFWVSVRKPNSQTTSVLKSFSIQVLPLKTLHS